MPTWRPGKTGALTTRGKRGVVAWAQAQPTTDKHGQKAKGVMTRAIARPQPITESLETSLREGRIAFLLIMASMLILLKSGYCFIWLLPPPGLVPLQR